MKRIHCTFLISIFAFLAISCSKDQKEVTLIARLPQINSDEKLYVDNFETFWNNGDCVYVNGQHDCIVSVTNDGSSTISGVTSSDTYHAIFPSEIVQDNDISNTNTIQINMPTEQVFETDGTHQKVKIPMGAVAEGNTLQFRNLCSLLMVRVSNTNSTLPRTITRIEVSAMDDGYFLSGEGIATLIGNNNDCITINNNGCNWVSLEFPENLRPTITAGSTNNYYLVLPKFASSVNKKDIMITIFTTDGYFSTQKTSKYWPNNVIAAVTCAMEGAPISPIGTATSVPMGSIAGAFSVNNTGTKVFFSKGNLQFNAALGTHGVATGGTKPGTWRFAEHQYDICGTDNQNISATYNGWIDLFGWATSGFDNTSVISSAVYFEPFSSSNTSNVTSNYGPSNTYGVQFSGTLANYDWGVYNTISNSPNTSWRTLKKSEWQYIMGGGNPSRSNQASEYLQNDNSKKMIYSKIIINGAKGILLFPDNFVCPYYLGIANIQNDTMNWNYCLTLSYNQFIQFEKRGCVFLPAGGGRSGTNYSENYSYYWSSNTLNSANQNHASGVRIGINNIDIIEFNRCYGASVRLVHTI